MTISPAHIRFPRVQVTSTRFLPLLVSTTERSVGEGHVLDEFTQGIAVAYSFGPPFGERLVSWSDLDRICASIGARCAGWRMDHLYENLRRAQIHGQPAGADALVRGARVERAAGRGVLGPDGASVPGELVVGCPARDVVIITGSDSRPGWTRPAGRSSGCSSPATGTAQPGSAGVAAGGVAAAARWARPVRGRRNRGAATASAAGWSGSRPVSSAPIRRAPMAVAASAPGAGLSGRICTRPAAIAADRAPAVRSHERVDPAAHFGEGLLARLGPESVRSCMPPSKRTRVTCWPSRGA